MKRLTMSKYRFREANTYSSGLSEYLWLPPTISWVYVHDVEAEDDCPDPGVHEVQRPAGREEGGDQAEQHKTHQNGDQDTSHSREIDLSLEGEDGEGEGDGGADPHGHEDLVRPVPGGHRAQHEALGQREQPEEDEVVRRLPPDALAAGEGDQRDEHDHHGQDPELGVDMGVRLDALQGEDADNGHRDDKLDT